MATPAHNAPLGESSTNVAGVIVGNPLFYELGKASKVLIDKVKLNIPKTHKSWIHTETLTLHSTSEHINLQFMASKIGIPSTPTLKPLSQDFPLEACMRLMVEGLQLHQDLLLAVTQHTAKTDSVSEMLDDIRDLLRLIKKMLKMVQAEPKVPPVSTKLTLRLSGEYEVQVAMHLTLVQLQTFSQDVGRSLRNIVRPSETQHA